MITNAQDDTLTIDTAKLEEVMAIIETHPELHHQARWVVGDFSEELAKGIENMTPLEARMQEVMSHSPLSPIVVECGTAACFAGWVSNLYAKEFGWTPQSFGRYFTKTDDAPFPLGTAEVSDLAIHILGLTDPQAIVLFHGDNTIPMLRSMVKDLANTGDVRSLEKYQEEDSAHV